MMKHILATILFIFSLGLLSAQTVRLDFAGPQVQVLQGTSWSKAVIGQDLKPDNQIRIPKGALVILGLDHGSVQLKEGTHVVSKVMVVKTVDPGLATDISRKIKIMSEDPSKSKVLVGGVRAAEAASSLGKVQWSEDDSPVVLLGKGEKSLGVGAVGDAYGYFSQALKYSLAKELNETRLAIMEACLRASKPAMAMIAMDAGEMPPDHVYYGEWALAKAQVLLGLYQYGPLLDWTGTVSTGKLDKAELQALAWMKSLAYKALGNTEDHQKTLEQAVAYDPDNALVKEIRKP